jgi:hypothetical protein
MFKKIIIAALLINSVQLMAWGPTGHRAIGKVAENHLSKKASTKIKSILGDESLAIVSIWMDEERSNPAYNHTHDWHWVTIPDGMNYHECDKNPNGDIIMQIERITTELKAGGLSKEDEVIRIKMLVHLIGDIHMPLHAGREGDKGGNAIKVQWFGNSSNLHRVWDSDIIDNKQLSYTELASAIDHPTKSQLAQWQSEDILQWASESIALRDQVYNLPENGQLGYVYSYNNWAAVQLRLLQAGVRLAGVLNAIYG